MSRSRRSWLAALCFLPAILCVCLFALEQPLLESGTLNKEDLTIAAGTTGTLEQELLNVWTWDAAIGLLCVVSVPAVLAGVWILVSVYVDKRSAMPSSDR